jgi:hypothetical protein
VIAFVRSRLSVTLSRVDGANPTASATLAALTSRISIKDARRNVQATGGSDLSAIARAGAQERPQIAGVDLEFFRQLDEQKLLGFLAIEQATDRAMIRFGAQLVVERDLPLRDCDDED